MRNSHYSHLQHLSQMNVIWDTVLIESIALYDACLLEQNQVEWLLSKPNLPPEIDKPKSDESYESFDNAWCSNGAALPPNNPTLTTTESFLNEVSNLCSVPVFSSYFLPLNTDSVGHALLANVMQVVQGAANAHHLYTACLKLNNTNK